MKTDSILGVGTATSGEAGCRLEIKAERRECLSDAVNTEVATKTTAVLKKIVQGLTQTPHNWGSTKNYYASDP